MIALEASDAVSCAPLYGNRIYPRFRTGPSRSLLPESPVHTHLKSKKIENQLRSKRIYPESTLLATVTGLHYH